MAITRIGVVRENVIANAENPEARHPVFVVATEGQPMKHAISVAVLGPSVFKFDPAGHPQIGNRVWVETTAEIVAVEVPNSAGSGLSTSNCGRC